jgi:hypothetical protein
MFGVFRSQIDSNYGQLQSSIMDLQNIKNDPRIENKGAKAMKSMDQILLVLITQQLSFAAIKEMISGVGAEDEDEPFASRVVHRMVSSYLSLVDPVYGVMADDMISLFRGQYRSFDMPGMNTLTDVVRHARKAKEEFDRGYYNKMWKELGHASVKSLNLFGSGLSNIVKWTEKLTKELKD